MQESSICHIIKELRVLKAAVIETRSVEEYADLRRKHVLKAYSSMDSSNAEQQSESES